jgi:hypothetical protein
MTHFMVWLNDTHPTVYACIFFAVCSLPFVVLVGTCLTAPRTDEENRAFMDKEF